ncbi:MAG: rRNA adenine dimethyltransferase family protein, partial [Patescibacteria group bacterium]
MISSAKPKKSLGQNFLTSVGAVNKIVDTAVEATVKLEVGPPTGGTTSNFTVLEIGPGKGVLTKALLKKFEKVLAVEKDDNLFVELGEKFTKEIETGQLTLIHGDILELTPGKLGLISKNYATVANLPYYITGQFLRSWLETEFPPKFMVLMLQKEVAERITARDGKESLLSISVKAYGEPKYIETIKRGSFYPIPNVDSAILLINNISKEFFKRRGSEVSFIANP